MQKCVKRVNLHSINHFNLNEVSYLKTYETTTSGNGLLAPKPKNF